MTTYPQLDLANQKADLTIHTNKGDIDIVLFDEETPLTAKNFRDLAARGYYNDVIFHRIIEDFMIQGGDPTGTGMGGESVYGGSFQDEFTPTLFNLRGALSMANAGPNTNGSQFFIVTARQVPAQMLGQMKGAAFPEEIIETYAEQGGAPWLDQRHTVFGHVISGMEVVDAIESVETDAQDKPKEPITIESITSHT